MKLFPKLLLAILLPFLLSMVSVASPYLSSKTFVVIKVAGRDNTVTAAKPSYDNLKINSKTTKLSVNTPLKSYIAVPFVLPSISYPAGAKSYPTGTAITALTINNTGGAVPGVTIGGVTTIAGSGTNGFADNATGTLAAFSNPYGIAMDASGNAYVADYGNNRIRKITAGGAVTTFAGTGATGSSDNATGTLATFNSPSGIAIDASGNLYVSEYNGRKIRKISTAGAVTTLAGSGTSGSDDNASGNLATFVNPISVCVDASGNVYVADANNHKIRKITSAGAVTTLAGTGSFGSVDNVTGTLATFASPFGIAVDASGNVYVAEFSGRKIRKISPAGAVTTLAGTGVSGSADNATGTLATFRGTNGLALDASGNLYVADGTDHKIRKISPSGAVTTFAGSGTSGTADNTTATVATFDKPFGITVDSKYNVYVIDQNGRKMRKITQYGYSISPALPTGLSFDVTTGTISGTPTVVTAATNYTVTAINSDGAATTTVNIAVTPALNITGSLSAFSSCSGTASGVAQSFSVSGASLTADINIMAPTGFEIARTSAGVYSSSLTLTQSGGTVAITSVFARLSATATGSPSGSFTATSAGATAQSITATGTVNALPAVTLGVVSGVFTNATSFNVPYSGATGSPNQYSIVTGIPTAMSGFTAVSNATLGATPISVTIPASSANTYHFNVTVKNSTTGCVSAANAITLVVSAPVPPNISYAGSTQTYRINTAITPLTVTNTGGVVPTSGNTGVTTIAGSGTAGFADNAVGTLAAFNKPYGIALDASGNAYVADDENNRIRKITAGGAVTTFAGTGAIGTSDNAVGTLATFHFPSGIAIDASGNLYVSDYAGRKIRKISATGVVTTLAGSGSAGSADNATGNLASFVNPISICVDASGNVFVADESGHKIRKVTSSGVVTTLAGTGTSGSVDNATGTLATFANPYGIAVDASGNVYVAENVGKKIRKISPAGTVTTFAGSGVTGSADNVTGTLATFLGPRGLALDASGNLYVTDGTDHKIRKISPSGAVTTLAGSGTRGSANNINATLATFNAPSGIAVDGTYNVFVTESGELSSGPDFGRRIRKISQLGYSISPALPTGLSFDVTTGTISGTPTVVTAATNYTVTAINSDGAATTTVNIAVTTPTLNITGSLSAFSSCAGTASVVAQSFSVSGASLTADISIMAPSGFEIARTSAGVYSSSLTLTQSGGTVAITSVFARLSATATGSPSGSFTATSAGATAQSITATGTVNALPAVTLGVVSGVFTNATSFNVPYSGATGSPNQYSIVTGSPTAMSGFTAVSNATLGATPISVTIPASSANTYHFNVTVRNSTTGCVSAANAITLVVSAPVPPNISYAGSTQTYRINTAITPLSVTNTGGVVPTSGNIGVTTIAGSGFGGFADNAVGTLAQFSNPSGGIALDASGNAYVADQSNNRIRKITPEGAVTTFAGTGARGSTDNATGTLATFNRPLDIAIDAAGNLYVSDSENRKIRKISATGAVTTLAGSGSYGKRDNAIGTLASFQSPNGICVDAFGNVFVADGFNHTIRKITSAGVVTTLAGRAGTFGTDDNVIGTLATFATPYGIAVDASGNLYVSDRGGKKIRKISPAGAVTTLAGSGAYGIADNATGTLATFRLPMGLALDASGNLYVADIPLVRKISPSGEVTTFAGSGTVGLADNTTATLATFRSPIGIAIDVSKNVYVADAVGSIRKISEFSYSISPALPTGLHFDVTTGTISGTPTKATPATVYTITGINTIGSSSTTVTLSTISATISMRGSLTAFKTCAGTASAPQSFEISGSNLLGDINVTAPTGFELATTSGGAYSSSLTLTQSSGSVSSTSVYIRLSVTANAASAFGAISSTSTTAVAQSLVITPGIVTINALPVTPAITAGSVLSFCSGGNVVLSSSATTGNQWYKDGTLINNATGNSYTASLSGSYTVIVTNANGCSSAASAAAVVTANSNPVATIAEGFQLAFSNCATTTINLNANSGSNLGYQWSNAAGNIASATTQQYTVTTSGDYRVKVTDANGCFAISAVTKVLSVPTATSGGNTAVCAGSIVSLNTGGTFVSPTYQWLKDGTAISGATAATYTAAATGSYNVSVTSGGATTGSCPIIVTVNSLPNVTTDVTPGNTVCSGTPLVINATVAGTNTYQWLDNGNVINNAIISKLNITTSGVFSVRVTDTNGCMNTSAPATITINPLPTLSAITGRTVVTVKDTTKLVSTPDGGIWTSSNTAVATVGSTTGVVTGVGAGTATISYTLVNTNNCSATVNTLVTVNGIIAKPIVTAGSATTFCSGGSTVLTSNALSGNQWFKDGIVIGGATAISFTATTSGSYTVAVGGTSSDAIAVVVNTIPDASIQQGAELAFTNCANTIINLTVLNNNPGIKYQWRNANGDIPNATNPQLAVTVADSYSLRVTDSICSATSGVIKVTGLPSVSVAGSTLVCDGTSIALSANTGAFTSPTYQWQNGATAISGATESSFNPTVSGNYSLVVISAGVTSTSCAISITVNALPTVSITSDTSVCEGNLVNLIATTTASSYQWLSSGNFITSATTSSYRAAVSDQYSVQVTDNNGCSNTSAVSTVSVKPLPVLQAIAGAGSVCVNSTINLSNTETGGEWTSSNTAVATVDVTGQVTGVAVGTSTITYTVTTNGCATAVTKNITVNPRPLIVTQPVASLVQCTVTNASIGITATGSGLSYQWYQNGVALTGATTATYSKNNLVAADAGNYNVVVMGGCGNVTSNESVWTVNPSPTVSIASANSVVVLGLTTQLTSTVGGGVTTYNWTPAAYLNNATTANPVARVMGNTTYTLLVTNALGCTATANTTVSVIENLFVQPTNVFTPNGDGINDRFTIKNLDAYPVNKLQVFDRSGKMLYERNNYTNDWDGTVSGRLLSKDTYYYILSVKGTIVKRGTITLVR